MRSVVVSPGAGIGQGSIVFVGTSGGVWRSTDGCGSWIDCNSSLPNCDVRSLAIIPDAEAIRILAGTWGGGVFVSSDTGTSWTPYSNALGNFNVRSLAVLGELLFVGTEGGVFRNDLGTWIAVNAGLTSTFVRTLAVLGTDLFAGTWGNGVFRSSDGGTSWVWLGAGMANPYIRSLMFMDTVLFAGTEGSGVYRSTNKGTTWPWNNTDRGMFYSFAASGGRLWAGTDAGVLVSTNRGIMWTGDGPWMSIYTLAVGQLNGQPATADLFAGTWLDGVLRSTDNGVTWTWAGSGLPATVVLALAAMPAQGGGDARDLLVGTWGSGVFISTDRGTSWTASNVGLTHPWVYALAVSGSHVFAGTRGGGVFVSHDRGASWAPINEGLAELDVVSLALTDAELIAGTEGGGVWKRSLSGIRYSEVGDTDVPVSFRLEQNYPNPFNPSTTIRYGLPNRSYVTLTVFNPLGQQVATLVQDEQEAGYHEVQFDASGLASGVYLYRLQAGDFVQTRKLVFVR